MKRLSIALSLLFLTLPLLAVGNAAESLVGETLSTPVDAKLPELDENKDREASDALVPEGEPQETEVKIVIICGCQPYTTPEVTKVGATCSNARQNAAIAARALAVCSSETEGPCGSKTNNIGPCSPNPGGGFQATATTSYGCTVCREVDICQ